MSKLGIRLGFDAPGDECELVGFTLHQVYWGLKTPDLCSNKVRESDPIRKQRHWEYGKPMLQHR